MILELEIPTDSLRLTIFSDFNCGTSESGGFALRAPATSASSTRAMCIRVATSATTMSGSIPTELYRSPHVDYNHSACHVWSDDGVVYGDSDVTHPFPRTAPPHTRDSSYSWLVYPGGIFGINGDYMHDSYGFVLRTPVAAVRIMCFRMASLSGHR